MAAYWRVSEVRVVDDRIIWVRFVDGLEGEVCFPPGFFQGVFAPLSDPEKFREVAVVDGAVTWPGGLDIAPDAMYDEVKLQNEQVSGKVATISTHGYRFDRDAANERTKQ
jgi:hypothetical protein